jgi:nucleoside-diphosphate-sugar epimerase
MHALVTGCAGFIGSHLAEELLASGATVRGVDVLTDYYDPARKLANLSRAQESQSFEYLNVDLCSVDLEMIVDGIDVIFHLAGQPGVRLSWSTGFRAYVERNVLATQRLLEATRESDVRRFVYASSSSVYGNAARYPVHEDDLPSPHSPYGVTKLAAEHLCGLYAANWAVPTTSLRYFTVYGPRQRPDMGFARFFEAILNARPIPLFGSGSQVRDFTFVNDIVAATLAAGSADVPPGTVCNVAGGSSISLRELFPLLADVTGSKVTLEHLPEQAGDVQRTGGAIDRAATLLHWAPKVALTEGLARQFEWQKRLELM